MNKSKKFRRTWTITAAGKSRIDDHETFSYAEAALDKMIRASVEAFGIFAQDTKIEVKSDTNE